MDHQADSKKPAEMSRPEMNSLHVTSHIEYRFAKTLITSRLANPAATAQEIFFSVVIPETAFITKFLMEVQGKVYEAYVKEKEEAKHEYNAAVAAGQAAAHVARSARDSNRFTVSVNIEPKTDVTFKLTYEELLTRRLGAYNHVINLDPGQVVSDLKVDVYIKESRDLTLLRVPALRSGNEVDADEHSTANPHAIVWRTSSREAHVSFSPTADQQKQLGKVKPIAGDVEEGQVSTEAGKDEGLGGQFVVQYDVDRDPLAGEVLVNDGFFVHFFAPKDLSPLRKHALFVLDLSGSMQGRKLDQLKQAMYTILDDLQQGDYFNIIEFSCTAKVWNLDSSEVGAAFSESGPTLAFPATTEYVAKAKESIKNMNAVGGTNIYDAMTTVLRVARTGLEHVTVADNITLTPLIVFLTDGDATVGETRRPKILSVVQELNDNPKAAVFSLAFGDDADLDFLKTLSLRNAGFAKKIYEASDAALQLRDFYRQIASPLLTNVTFDYVPDMVVKESTTKVNFHTLFTGAELVVAGKLQPASPDSSTPYDGVVGKMHGSASTGECTMCLPRPINIVVGVPTPAKDPTSLERLWAYLTIKQLLEKDEEDSGADDESDKDKKNDTGDISPKKQALALALKYSFVTKLTSLVVVKPNEAVNTSKAVDPVDGTKNSAHGVFAANSPAYSAAFAGPGAGVQMSRMMCMPLQGQGFQAQSFQAQSFQAQGGCPPPSMPSLARQAPSMDASYDASYAPSRGASFGSAQAPSPPDFSFRMNSKRCARSSTDDFAMTWGDSIDEVQDMSIVQESIVAPPPVQDRAMTTYKLTYFPGKALAEPIRLLFVYAGQDFEDVRFDPADWPTLKTTMPFGKVPVLEFDGKTVHQSLAIARFLANKYKLTGDSAWDALQCDVVVDTVSDFRQAMADMSYDSDEVSKEKKKGPLTKETVPFYLAKFDAMVAENNGYFVGGKLTWTDLYWIGVIDYFGFMMGFKEGSELIADYKNLVEHQARIQAIPSIKAWIDKRPKSDY